MAAKRKRKKKKDTWLTPETKASIVAILLLAVAGLVMISFAGQGVFLQSINNFLSMYFGFVSLLIPFLLIAFALILFKVEAAWSKPNVLIGAIISTFGLLLVGKAGSLGSGLFFNLARLISAPGVYILSIAIIVTGIMIMFQASFKELFEYFHQWQIERQAAQLEKEALQAELLAATASVEAFSPNSNAEFLDSGEPNLAFKDNHRFGKLGFGKKNSSNSSSNSHEVELNEIPQNSPLAEPALLSDTTEDQLSPASAALLEEIDQRASQTGVKKVNILGKKVSPDSDPANQSSIISDEDFELPVIDQSKLVWEYPTLDILSDKSGGEADRGDIKANAQIIQDTLESFGIRARVVEVNRGPSVTQYALEIAMGTKISKVTSLANNLAMALAAPNGQIRIEAPIAGKSLVGIEVPNYKSAYVTLRQMLSQDIMINNPSKLAVALGIDVASTPIIADIARMPHALIAGATGSGKSVGINSFLCSVLFRSSPQEVKLILVDPKRVEMTPYNDIPHLLTPVIYDVPKIVSALKWLTAEMDLRYEKLAEAGVRNILSFNEKAGYTAMCSIVLVVDEFADIMMYAPAEVEECIARLTQKARAVGIHTILATQRPSVNVVTGLIKSNTPTRIAFNVASVMDSRVILDTPGAEKLLGNGDMLFVAPDKPRPVRVQGTYVSDEDVNSLTNFLRGQKFRPEYISEITTKFKANSPKGGKGAGGGDMDGGEDRDPLFADAVRVFANQEAASSSSIQRKLSVGYARAARILDQLCDAGFVGPANGSKPREVYREKVFEFLNGN